MKFLLVFALLLSLSIVGANISSNKIFNLFNRKISLRKIQLALQENEIHEIE